MGTMAALWAVVCLSFFVSESSAFVNVYHNNFAHYSWNSWSSWSTCHVDCTRIDTHTYTQSRSRTCHDNHFHHQTHTSHCGTHYHETRACTNNCAVNGGWDAWQKWSACTHTCGHATKTRQRSCDHPTPQHGGHTCSGASRDTDACKLADCPDPLPVWTTWSTWTPCSATCDGGSAVRVRHCGTTQESCPGNPFEKTNCATDPCPVMPVWSSWTVWGRCSSSCDNGMAVRVRHCGINGQDTCQGSTYEKKSCGTACVTDGGWSQYTDWSTCNVVCGYGHVWRTRTCSNPAPSDGGANCEGNILEHKLCYNGECLADVKTCYDSHIMGLVNTSSYVMTTTLHSPGVSCELPEHQQEESLSAICRTTLKAADWSIGSELTGNNCASMPLFSPVAFVPTQGQGRKYGILMDCQQDRIQIVDLSCGLDLHASPLNQTNSNYHIVVM